MADTVSFRLAGDVAAVARVGAERGGLPLSGYVNELLRTTRRAPQGSRPAIVPWGRTDEATATLMDRGERMNRRVRHRPRAHRA